VAFAYDVTIVLREERAFQAFVAWLREKHCADVCAAGGCEGEIVLVDAPRTVIARYRFPSRDAFSAYARDHAARFREEALELLETLGASPGNGVDFARATGEIVPVR
jgi:hypothetical protein